jgi:hypothetical protein
MKEYRSVKTVWALEIDKVLTDECGIVIRFKDGYLRPVALTNDQLKNKPTPFDGWYLVRYSDDYFSFSPPEQFEKGNISLHELVERAAKAAQEANYQLCQAIGDPADHWDDAPDILKQSVRAGVLSILRDPTISPEKSHESWLEYKRAEDWKYGPVKDVEKKEHPCFLPYGQLPENQRLKDHLFGIVVRAVLGV